jgi:alanine dehydrogenase
MKIGIPKECKILEGRVGLIPQACADLLHGGHELILQQGAGLLSGYTDQQYQDLGVRIVASAAEVYDQADLIIKVKEPWGDDLSLLQSRHLLFCFLHLAANPELAAQLQAIGLTAIAFETVEAQGSLPLLAPMSDIAGRVATQVGAHLLHQPSGGRGILLGGLPAAGRGQVVIIGAGVAGSNAAQMAAAMGAQVTIFDRKREKLSLARDFGNNVTALYPYRDAIGEAVSRADLLIGAVLIPGARTPHIVSRAMVKNMKKRSVIIDISVDQGGCVETIRPTDYQQPTYLDEEVIHFGVTNMPGAVPRSASQALSAAILPYALLLASGNWRGQQDLLNGINIEAGQLVHPVLQEALA